MPNGRVRVAFWTATAVSVLLLGVVWTIAGRVRGGGAGLEDDLLLAVAAAGLAAAGLVAGRIVLVLGRLKKRGRGRQRPGPATPRSGGADRPAALTK